jgi:hypothetical protein
MSTATAAPPPRPKLTEQEHQDKFGPFLPKNPGGPGNPYARRVAALRKAMQAAVTDDDIMAVTRALIEKAKKGDTAAARLVFQYALGKPQDAPDADRMDLHEWNQIKDESKVRKEMDDAVKGVNPDWAVWFMSMVRPYMTYAYHHTLKNGMNAAFAAADAREAAAKAEAERSADGSTGEPNIRKPKADRPKPPPKERAAPAERPVNRMVPMGNGEIGLEVPDATKALYPALDGDPVWLAHLVAHGQPLANGSTGDSPPTGPSPNGSTRPDR